MTVFVAVGAASVFGLALAFVAAFAFRTHERAEEAEAMLAAIRSRIRRENLRRIARTYYR